MATSATLLGGVPPTAVLPQLFWSSWDRYDKKEKAHHFRIRVLDHVGLVILAAAYGGTAAMVAPSTADFQAPPPRWLAVQMVGAIFALYNLHLQLYALVRPDQKSPQEYFVTDGPLGRFVWMTHQTINLVAVHWLFSVFAAVVSPKLAVGTYVLALPISGLAAFMTVQFFLLVWPLEDVHKEYQIWAERGVCMKLIDLLRHVPPGVLAVLDVTIVKQRSVLLKAMPSPGLLVAINMVYAATYLSYVRVNFKLSGQYPYSFLRDLGESNSAWAKFGGMQCAILSLFAVVLQALASFSPAAW